MSGQPILLFLRVEKVDVVSCCAQRRLDSLTTMQVAAVDISLYSTVLYALLVYCLSSTSIAIPYFLIFVVDIGLAWDVEHPFLYKDAHAQRTTVNRGTVQEKSIPWFHHSQHPSCPRRRIQAGPPIQYLQFYHRLGASLVWAFILGEAIPTTAVESCKLCTYHNVDYYYEKRVI